MNARDGIELIGIDIADGADETAAAHVDAGAGPLVCISCGARQSDDGTLPCFDH